MAVIILKKKNNAPANSRYLDQRYSGDRHEIQSIIPSKANTPQHERPDHVRKSTVQDRIRNAFEPNSSTMANARNNIDDVMRSRSPPSPTYKRHRSRSPKPPDKPVVKKDEEEQVKVYVVDDATDQINYPSDDDGDDLVSPRIVCSPHEVNTYVSQQSLEQEQPESMIENPPLLKDTNDEERLFSYSQPTTEIRPRFQFESTGNGCVPSTRALIEPTVTNTPFTALRPPSAVILSNEFKSSNIKTEASDCSRQTLPNGLSEKSSTNQQASGSNRECNNLLPSFEQPHKNYKSNGQCKASEEISCLVEIDKGVRKALTAEIKGRYERVDMNGNKKYVCKMCRKSFERWCNLNAHITMHLDMKPYVCKVCGVKYKLRAILNEHIRGTHFLEGRKARHCKKCGGKFKSCQALQQHVLTMKH